MSETTAELVNLAQLQNTGTRTVTVKLNGVEVKVTEKMTDNGVLSKELGLATQNALKRMRASERLLAMPDDAPDREAAEEELRQILTVSSNLDDQWTFDDRRISVRRIADRFTNWNIEGLPITFDTLYAAELSTEFYDQIYNAVRAIPIVGKPNGKH